ncbi:BBE domain-containing protein [Mesorhizobium kowhaii]|uniref:BBE domain-containing protein n=1 Tax=Mesorhizobium kowhaii TaxID=1300272 RepID=UPI0035E51541
MITAPVLGMLGPVVAYVNIIGSAASMTGVHALSYARGHFGIEPHIIGGARSAGRVSNAKNPLADAVEQVSEKLKAFSIFDTGGPNSTASLAYRANFSSRFSYLVDPLVRVASAGTIVVKPAAPFAGVISAMHLYPIDGAVNRRKTDAQAWNMRDALWSMVIVRVGSDAAQAPALKQWTRDYWTGVHPYNLAGAYPNFMMDDEGEARLKATFGDNFPRLATLKRKHDP